ncbi:MAG: hypothetical protein PSX71_03965 [bacterium]|nr:hypothetical protein [bacterium]
MSSSLHVWRVDLRLQASRILLTLILVLHLAALAALVQTGFPWYGCLPVVCLLLLSCLLSLRPEKNAGTVTLHEQAGDWWLETPQQQVKASLQHSQVWRYLVVMDFLCRHESRCWRQRVVVFPDSVPADDFRRLRVRLRYGPRVQDAHLS